MLARVRVGFVPQAIAAIATSAQTYAVVVFPPRMVRHPSTVTVPQVLERALSKPKESRCHVLLASNRTLTLLAPWEADCTKVRIGLMVEEFMNSKFRKSMS